MENKKTMAVVVGGLFVGLLSSVPFVSVVNACCCAWAVMGGILAAFLYVRKAEVPVLKGEGAVLGAMAGGIGALIYLLIGLPLGVAISDSTQRALMPIYEMLGPEAAERARMVVEQQANMTFFEKLLQPQVLGFSLLTAVLLAGFTVAGGILGVLLFEKRKSENPFTPPPPQNFGNPGGGFGAPPPPNYGG